LTVITTLDQESFADIGNSLLIALGDPMDIGELAAIEHVDFLVATVNAFTVARPSGPLTPPGAVAAGAAPAAAAAAALAAAPAAVAPNPQILSLPRKRGRSEPFAGSAASRQAWWQMRGETWRTSSN
jgi:hypothetical protein